MKSYEKLNATLVNNLMKKITELNEEKAKFKNIFDNASDGILLADITTGKFAVANNTACKMVGYNEDEIRRLDITSIHPKKDLPYVLNQFDKLAKGEITLTKDIPVQRKDGSIFYAEISSTLVKFGGNTYITGIFRDTTERKKTEEAIKQSENKYKTLFDSSSDAIMMLAPPNWDFTSCNRATIKLFKSKDEKEFISKNPGDVSPKYQPDGQLSSVKAKKMIIKAIKEGSNLFEWTHKEIRGEDFPATVLLTRIELDGKTLLQATVRDITERKKTEEKLMYFKKVIDESSDAIGMSTPQGKHYYQNAAFDRLFGLSVTDVEGTKGLSSTIYADEKVGLEIFKTIMGGNSWVGEVEMLVKGIKTSIFLNAYPIKDQKRRVIGLVGVHTDITERKRTENTLKLSEAKYKRIFDNLPLMVQSVTIGARISYVNKTWKDVLGYSDRDIKKLSLWAIICKSEHAHCKKLFKEVMLGKSLDRINTIFIAKSGKRIPVSGVAHPILKNGKVISTDAIFWETKR